MTLHLTGDDTRRVSAVAEALLAPSAGADPTVWWAGVEARMRELFGGANAMITWPEGPRLRYAGQSIDRAAEQRLEQLSAADPETGLHVNFDPGVVRWFEHRRAHRIEVWHEAENFAVMRAAGIDGPRGLFYNEGLVRAGFSDCSGASTMMRGSELFLTVGYDRRGRGRFGSPGDAEILRMLLPTIRAAHHALATFAPRRAALVATIDAVRDALLVVAPGGWVLHHNVALDAALASEPERETVLRAMRRLADGLQGARGAALLPRAEAHVVTTTARYVLRATHAPALLWGVEGAVQVSLEAAGAVADPPPAVGLTAREDEVARLLARRLSNAEVAAALGVSAHTARHHTESVLRKLGVRRRADVGAALLRAAQ